MAHVQDFSALRLPDTAELLLLHLLRKRGKKMYETAPDRYDCDDTVRMAIRVCDLVDIMCGYETQSRILDVQLENARTRTTIVKRLENDISVDERRILLQTLEHLIFVDQR